MLRSLNFASLFTASILFGACTAEQPTQPGTDELAGENGQDGETPKADGVDNFGFMEVAPMACTGPQIWCSKYDLSRVNRSTTVCFGGSASSSCPVHTIDWSALNLSQANIDKLENAIAGTTDKTGARVLVRGTFKSFVEFTALEPTEVWIAQRATGSAASGTFVRIFDRGIRCITAPCPQFEEGRLNSTREMAIDGFDFGSDDSLQERVYDATTKPDGVIIVGDRTTRSAVSFVEKLRSVDQVFLPVAK